MKIFFVSLIVAICSACSSFVVTDFGLAVKGEIESPAGSAAGCNLQLWLSEEGVMIRSFPVSGKFRRVFTIGPLSKKYFIVVSCVGPAEIYRSEAFHWSREMSPAKPFDIGKLSWPR